MSASASSIDRHGGYPAGQLVNRLVAAGSELGSQLDRWHKHSLREYLAAVVAPAHGVNDHRLRLAHALERYLCARGDHALVDAACDHLLSVGVIQQADHSNLLLDSETFLNNFLFFIACRETGLRIMLTSQCSTVSCLWKRRPLAGPVFLRTRGMTVKLFPLSKRRLKLSTFCCLPGPSEMTIEPVDQRNVSGLLDDQFLALVAGRKIADAPRGYREINDRIWTMLDLTDRIRRVAVDEAMASECIASHIMEPTSPVYRLIFEPAVRDCFLAVKRELVKARDNLVVNHATPDFFWIRGDTHLRKVVLRGKGRSGALVTASDGALLPVDYEPRAMASALRSGILYGDRVLAYVVRCLLPGVVAVGGTSQQDYVNLYRRVLIETDRRVSFLDRADRTLLERKKLSRLGGMPLVELDSGGTDLIAHLSPCTRLDALERAYLDKPVHDTIGGLRCAAYLEEALVRAGVVDT